jgi:hypothetical protein
MSTCLKQSVVATKPDTRSIKLDGAFSPSSEIAATATPDARAAPPSSDIAGLPSLNRLDCADNWEGQLRKLHYSRLQQLCFYGPEPPFDELHLSRLEWSDSFCEGRGCKSAMIRKILDRHERNIKHKRLGNETPRALRTEASPTKVPCNPSWDVMDDEKLALLSALDSVTLQRFCYYGPDPPFDMLLLSRREWKSCFLSELTPECREKAVSRICELHSAAVKIAAYLERISVGGPASELERNEIFALFPDRRSTAVEEALSPGTSDDEDPTASAKDRNAAFEQATNGDKDAIWAAGGNGVMLLNELHYRTLQRFCLQGPSFPFQSLLLSRSEWKQCLCTGRGCKSEMLRRIWNFHTQKLMVSQGECKGEVQLGNIF